MTDDVYLAMSGDSVTYTITASNSGPSSVPSATVADTFPAILTCTWMCGGFGGGGGGTCTAAGSGSINDTVSLPVGGWVTYTASCTIAAAATGSLVNTATVSSSVTDPTPVDNSATDTDTLVPPGTVHVSITKTDGVATAVPGGSVTYTITASNVGPNTIAAIVSDRFTSPFFLGCPWTCVGAGGGTCTGAGTAAIDDTVTLPAGGSVTYTASCHIHAAATGLLLNTAIVHSSFGEDSATDADTLTPTPTADLAIAKTDGLSTAQVGTPITYVITASNAGPSAAPGTAVQDVIPAGVAGATWDCLGAFGGTCTAAGSGNINDRVDLPPGGSVTYVLSGTIAPGASGDLVNTATVTPPAGVSDGNTSNNAATDTTFVGLRFFTLTPCRLMDTRSGPLVSPLVSQVAYVLPPANNCVPPGAKAIALNIVATESTAAGNIRLYPAGLPVPTIATLTYGAGQTRGNNTVVKLNFPGQFSLYVAQPAATTVHAIIDVFGYFE